MEQSQYKPWESNRPLVLAMATEAEKVGMGEPDLSGEKVEYTRKFPRNIQKTPEGEDPVELWVHESLADMQSKGLAVDAYSLRKWDISSEEATCRMDAYPELPGTVAKCDENSDNTVFLTSTV